MAKRLLSLMVVCSMLAGTCVCASADHTVSYDVKTSSGTTISDVTFDASWLVQGNNEVYYDQLAKAALSFASEAYTIGKDDSAKKLYEDTLGMEDYQAVILNADDYDTDQNDLTKFTIAHQVVKQNFKDYEVVVVAVEGSNCATDWSSNFDFGADCDDYYDKTGDHPDWEDKENHKGFDVTAKRVEDQIQQYCDEYLETGAKKVILFTGHSRGAAIANILAADYEQDTEFKSFGYTFATPATTTAEDAADTKTVFNVINTDDFITYYPLNQWGFVRYGVDLKVSGTEYADAYNALTGKTYVSAQGSAMDSLFAAYDITRENAYTIRDDYDKAVFCESTEEALNAKVEASLAALKETNSDRYVSFYTKQISNSYQAYYKTCFYYTLDVLNTIINKADLLNTMKSDSSTSVLSIALPILVERPLPSDQFMLLYSFTQKINTKGAATSHAEEIYDTIVDSNNFGYEEADFFQNDGLIATVFNNGGVVAGVGAGAVLVVGAVVAIVVQRKRTSK